MRSRASPTPWTRRIKSGPSVFYIFAVTWNLHPALNFPVKYTTFHVTHTNPAAISLSLNRAESLYHRVRCSCSWDSSYWLAGPKGEATELCLSLTLSPAWPRPPPLNSTLLWSWHFFFQQGSIWLYCTLLDCQGGLETASGPQRQPANTSHKKHRVHTHTQHIHRHFHTNSRLITHKLPPSSSVCSQLPGLLRVHLR